jgi:hypothetical protein
MSKGVEPVLVTRQEIIVFPKVEVIVVECIFVVVNDTLSTPCKTQKWVQV